VGVKIRSYFIGTGNKWEIAQTSKKVYAKTNPNAEAI
jgi:hypothetical protein